MASQHRVPVILTRPLARSERIARSLPKAAQPVLSPLLRIEFLDVAVDWQAFDGFIFTSENGVRAVDSPKHLQGRRAFCVGDRTAEVARQVGFDALSAHGNAEDLGAMIAEQAPSGRYLHVHGTHVRVALAERLSATGVNVAGVALYDQVALPLSEDALDFLQSRRVIVPLYSPRTAKLFFDACPEAPLAEVICLSEAIAALLADGQYAELKTMPMPSGSAMLDEISCRVTG